MNHATTQTKPETHHIAPNHKMEKEELPILPKGFEELEPKLNQ